MRHRHIGERVDLFYVGWAFVLETIGQDLEAHRIYLERFEGLRKGGERPGELLGRKYAEFQERMSRRWLKVLGAKERGVAPESSTASDDKQAVQKPKFVRLQHDEQARHQWELFDDGVRQTTERSTACSVVGSHTLDHEVSSDPLGACMNHIEDIKSTEQSNPRVLFSCLENWTQTVLLSEDHKNDARCIELWLLYARRVANPGEVVRFMREEKIGEQVALFYVEWAHMCEDKGLDGHAARIYLKGLHKNTQPSELLAQERLVFRQRTSRNWLEVLRGFEGIAAMPDGKKHVDVYGDAARQTVRDVKAKTLAASAGKPMFVVSTPRHNERTRSLVPATADESSCQHPDTDLHPRHASTGSHFFMTGPAGVAAGVSAREEEWTISTRLAFQEVESMFISPSHEYKSAVRTPPPWGPRVGVYSALTVYMDFGVLGTSSSTEGQAKHTNRLSPRDGVDDMHEIAPVPALADIRAQTDQDVKTLRKDQVVARSAIETKKAPSMALESGLDQDAGADATESRHIVVPGVAPRVGDGECGDGSKRWIWVNGTKYVVRRKLGRGSTCSVYVVVGPDNMEYALKHVSAAKLARNPQCGELLRKEEHILRRLKGSKHVIQLVDADHGTCISLVLELGSCDLECRLRDLERCEIPFDALPFVQAMACALDEVHSAGVIHGDVKPSNFVFVGGVLKLVDFGVSFLAEDDASRHGDVSFYGTLNYIAPEVLRRNASAINQGKDIWSFGCSVYRIVYGESPFEPWAVPHLTIMRILEEPIKIRPINNPAFEDFVASCLKHECRERTTIRALRSHPYLAA